MSALGPQADLEAWCSETPQSSAGHGGSDLHVGPRRRHGGGELVVAQDRGCKQALAHLVERGPPGKIVAPRGGHLVRLSMVVSSCGDSETARPGVECAGVRAVSPHLLGRSVAGIVVAAGRRGRRAWKPGPRRSGTSTLRLPTRLGLADHAGFLDERRVVRRAAAANLLLSADRIGGMLHLLRLLSRDSSGRLVSR